MKKSILLGLLPAMLGVFLFLEGGTAMAASSSPPHATQSSGSEGATPKGPLAGQDPVQAGCTQDATVVRQPQRALSIPSPLGIFGWKNAAIVIPQPSTSSIAIEDGNGATLGTITLFRSKTCGGFFGEVTVAGNPMTIQARSMSGTNLYSSPVVVDNLVYSPMIASRMLGVCAQGEVQEGNTTYIASACTPPGTLLS